MTPADKFAIMAQIWTAASFAVPHPVARIFCVFMGVVFFASSREWLS